MLISHKMQAGGSLVQEGKYSPFSVSTSLLWRINLEFDGFEPEANSGSILEAIFLPFEYLVSKSPKYSWHTHPSVCDLAGQVNT